MKIQSKFAVLDVRGKDRRLLVEHFRARPHLGACPPELRIPVIIHGYLDAQHSRDDGESVEFSLTVERVDAKKPRA